ncbi:hypothetical protein [Gordonia crocea]|uniref:Uncharacterized protein n=1 Tax=Gordonia crocea TaxID=589162 RepID=A0A7I9UWL0_9ACTN|nr:hypothetical protein [Gordonia crocea]GED97171.1 hypothetical protein nbrc107697_12100 [Gordonia crocea]
MTASDTLPRESTRLGCRSLVSVAHDPQLVDKVREQVRSWCVSKRWDAEAVADPGIAAVAPGVHASFVEEQRQDDSVIARWRFTQSESTGTWTTQITTLLHRDRSGVVWVDLYAPGDRRPAAPRIIRNIGEVIDALDGGYRAPATPTRAYPDDVESIYGALDDENRRGLIFLAGSDEDLVPMPQWVEYVTKLLKGTNGLATAYVLDPEATRELNRRLPQTHGVRPWTIRTFYPKPDFSSPDDALRHRVLSTGRIASSDDRGVAGILSNAALRNSTQLPLPNELIRIDRRLRALLDEAVIERASAAPRGSLSTTSNEIPAATVQATEITADTDDAQTSKKATGFAPAVLTALRLGLEKVAGKAELSIDSVNSLVSAAVDGIKYRENIGFLRRRLESVEAERGLLEDQSTELQTELDDARLDHAVAQQTLDEANRELRHLRRELAKLDHGTANWVTETTDLDVPPESFRDLLARIAELDHVVFTGETKPTINLDDHDPLGTWAKKTWNILRALNDYACLRAASEFQGSVDEYASNTPSGYMGLTGHKAGETPHTENHSKYGKIRTFPVPESVAPSGKVFMGAHVAIAKYGMISPRLHYYNDAAQSGMIYVGYIGKHLENFRTT